MKSKPFTSAQEPGRHAEQRESLDIPRESGDAPLALIDDILDFRKIEAGQLKLEPAEFDLHDAIRQSAKLLNQKVREKGIALEFAIGRDVPRMVNGDAFQHRQVLLNLLSNAIKYLDEGEQSPKCVVGKPMTEQLKKLPLSDEAAQRMTNAEGPCAPHLELVHNIERCSPFDYIEACDETALAPHEVNLATLSSLGNANATS